MKKLISLLLVFVIVLSLCACGGKTSTPDASEETQAPTETPDTPTEPNGQTPSLGLPQTPEELYGHINQLEPVNGVYKIWSSVGVQNMADHPDADFELLCNVDMEGATVRPLGSTANPFTGQIRGGNFTISNFTVQGQSDENFGFIAVNEGTVRSLLLKNVTFLPNKEARNIGALVGVNSGRVNQCIIEDSTLTVDAAAQDAACGTGAGKNTGTIINSDFTVDLAFNAPVSASVGGLVGVTEGGTVDYDRTFGKLDITGESKTVGLLAGSADALAFTECIFVGATSTLNGEMFEQYYGVGENVETVNCRRRDNHAEPLTEAQAALRDRAVEEMYKMATIEWRVDHDLVHTCTCSYSGCYTTYTPGYLYVGLPYNHYASSYERALYCLDENGYAKDWMYDMNTAAGYDMYIGSDCSASVQLAWWAVSNSAQFFRTGGMLPSLNLGCLPVGDYEWDYALKGAGSYTTAYTSEITQATGEQRMCEAYAQMRRGDAIMYQIEAGGHARLASSDAVVVRYDNGLIDPDNSYVLMHEQGSGYTDDEAKVKTSWRLDYKYTFANLYYFGALPVTCEEFLTGEMDPVTCELTGGADGYAGMFSGTVKANYQINSVTLKITDSKGNVTFERPMFPSTEKVGDYNTYHHYARGLCLEYDLAHFATALQDVAFVGGEAYDYTVSASLATGDKFELATGAFTLGSAQ